MIDDLPFAAEPQPSARTVAVTERKCRRHRWVRNLDTGAIECERCGRFKDEAASRRGKSATRNGKDAEREIAHDTGGKRVGHLGGPVDVLSPAPRRFAIQSKRVVAPPPLTTARDRRPTFPEWMWDELRKLPTTGGDVPALIVSDKPGGGHRRRALVVVDYRDYVDLYGEPEETE